MPRGRDHLLECAGMSERDVLASTRAEGYRIHSPVHDRPGSSSGQKRTISSSFIRRNPLQAHSLSRRRVFSMDVPNNGDNGTHARSRRVSATPWLSVQEPEPTMSIFSDEFDLCEFDMHFCHWKLIEIYST